MRLLIALTYYRPYTSGLTIYVERLATALVKRGHTVTVLTSQYDPSLPQRELLNGVRYFSGGAKTHTLVMRSRSGTIRYIEATHRWDKLMRISELPYANK